jgi:Calcineurin-like phosphoesterase
MQCTPLSIRQLQLRLQTDAGLRSSLSEIIDFLEASEFLLIRLMEANHLWDGPVPPSPGGRGDVDFGLVPYWVNHPPAFIQKALDENRLVALLWKALEIALPSHIDAAAVQRLVDAAQTQGIVAEDGTLYGVGTYEQLDPRWLWALVDYLYVLGTGDRAAFSAVPVSPVPLSGRQPDKVTIALVGDWGTGAFDGGQAQDVMAQIMRLKPDYIVHLGDVYYAGTNADFPPADEELGNFLNLWPNVPSFMLNSNHEMYSGAKGYFEVLRLPSSPFVQQQATSYFALQFAGWTVLGLDSAYFSSSPMFFDGALGGVGGPQGSWLATLRCNGLPLDPKKVIVLTHHNGLVPDGSREEPIAAELATMLGADPAAWYWGHVHNGIVYETPTVSRRSTRSRCVGHGAMPFGLAYGLADAPQVAYYAQTVNHLIPGNNIRLCNGFALLSLNLDGSVTEQFFEQNNDQPVFRSDFS